MRLCIKAHGLQVKKFTKQVLKYKSGFRFRRTFVYMRRKYGAHWGLRLALISLGVVLILIGLVMLIGPGPGWVVIVLGLIIIACVSYRLARRMDKAERMIVRQYRRLRKVRKKTK